MNIRKIALRIIFVLAVVGSTHFAINCGILKSLVGLGGFAT